MTGVFEVLAADDSSRRKIARQALVLSDARVEKAFGAFLRQASTAEEFDARLSLVEDDFGGIIQVACAEVGHEDMRGVSASLTEHLRRQAKKKKCFKCHGDGCKFCGGTGWIGGDDDDDDGGTTSRVASVHEARLPKMCPYHSEVTQVSLAQGEPRAGYDAMAQHAFGTNHCQSGEYEGQSCKFKPEMTTQGFWDTKAEKAQEKREQRVEQLEAQPEVPINEAPVSDSKPVDALPEETPGVDAELPAEGLSEAPETSPEPVLVAASIQKKADAEGFGGPEPKMDKRKWTPETVKALDADEDDGRWPTERKDILDPRMVNNQDELESVGKQVTERQQLPNSGDAAGYTTEKNIQGSGPTRTFPSGKHADPVTAAADDVERNPLEQMMLDHFGVTEEDIQHAVKSHRQ